MGMETPGATTRETAAGERAGGVTFGLLLSSLPRPFAWAAKGTAPQHRCEGEIEEKAVPGSPPRRASAPGGKGKALIFSSCCP